MALKKIRARFIFEMIGKPPEYLKETLGGYIKSLETEGIKVLSKSIHEPKLLEKEKNNEVMIYMTFAEVEMEIDNLNLLFGIVIRMLPSHIEVIEPDDFSLKNFDLSAVLSDLAIKLHKYDEIVKVLIMERDNFANQLNQIRSKFMKDIKIEELKPVAEKKDTENDSKNLPAKNDSEKKESYDKKIEKKRKVK